jgi:hypothetical protein
MQTEHHPPYVTLELEIASYLKASGHHLLGASPKGRLIEFQFDASAEKAVDGYFAGASLSARELFEAHRALRALIQQVKQHQSRSGSPYTCTTPQNP